MLVLNKQMARLVELRSQRQKKVALSEEEKAHCQKLLAKCAGCAFMQDGTGESCQTRFEMEAHCAGRLHGVGGALKSLLRESGIGPQPFVKHCQWRKTDLRMFLKDRKFSLWFHSNIGQEFPDWPLGSDDWYTLRKLRSKPQSKQVNDLTYSGWVNDLAQVLALPCSDYDLVWDWVLEHCKDSRSSAWLDLVIAATEKIRRVCWEYDGRHPTYKIRHLLR